MGVVSKLSLSWVEEAAVFLELKKFVTMAAPLPPTEPRQRMRQGVTS